MHTPKVCNVIILCLTFRRSSITATNKTKQNKNKKTGRKWGRDLKHLSAWDMARICDFTVANANTVGLLVVALLLHFECRRKQQNYSYYIAGWIQFGALELFTWINFIEKLSWGAFFFFSPFIYWKKKKMKKKKKKK